ncbi:MAG TPA: transposase [Pirellulales bacterium]|jgi:transposase|nr:transposase [Pirellulales bacterium]
MGMGKRKQRQESLFITADNLPRSDGHPFYQKLNSLLAEADFDRWIEARCRPFYAQEETRGKPSIPPGVYFRMLLVGYFEDISSQRGIAWRCADSLSLRAFLGVPLDQATPDHSTMSVTRQRLSPEVFNEVFCFVLAIAAEKRLLVGKAVGVDSTTLEANAAMKSIVRRDTGEDWQQYVTRLMRADGTIAADHEPTAEEVRRYDRKRKKTASNADWVSTTDPEARITKLKDGRTHLAYKSEHVVDLKSEILLAAEIRPADHADQDTLVDSVIEAKINLEAAGSDVEIEEVVADKGYHANATLELAADLDLRTYIPEPQLKDDRVWTDKPEEFKRAVVNNRRRMARAKGKRLGRLRSERVERSFAHVCDTGGARRSWLRGLEDVTKRYRIAAAAHNLGRIMRLLFGIGKPRVLQGPSALVWLVQLVMNAFWRALLAHARGQCAIRRRIAAVATR